MRKLILITATTGLLFAACKKEQTVWETDWAAPIINDTLSLANMVNDSTLSEVGGFYVLDLSRTLFDLNISEFVTIPDTTIEESIAFSGSISINPGFQFWNNVEEHDLSAEGVQFKTVKLKEGYIDVGVENPLGTKTIFKVKLPGVTLDGVPFEAIYEAPAGSMASPGVVSETIDLSGYVIDMTGLSGGDFNVLLSDIKVSTDPAGPTITITPADITKVYASFRDVKIDYARGYFGNQLVSDTSEVFIEMLDKIQAGTIDLPNTTITFEIENGLKVGAQGLLSDVSNTNHAGTTINLTGSQIGTPFNIDPATGNWMTLTPSYKQIVFNSANSNIEAYLENLGSKHNLGYSLELNPWGNVSGGWDEIFPQSRLAIRMHANMPLNIGMDGIILRDTFDISLNQDPEKTRIKSGQLILQASNGFPIAGTINLMMLNAQGNLIHTVNGSSTLQSSEFGTFQAQHGVNVMNSELIFTLSEDVLNDIDDIKHIIVESSFNTINPSTSMNEPMNIPVGAFLAIKLKTKFITENRF